MKDESIQTGSIDSLHPPIRPAVELAETTEHVAFVLRYDEEITYLVNEGLVRPGTQPSGLK